MSTQRRDFLHHEDHRVHEADPRRWHVGFGSDTLHLHPDEVVGERDAPELLPNACGCFRADGFPAIEQVRLELVVRNLGLPSLVIKLDQLLRRILLSVEQRREKRRARKALLLVVNGPQRPGRGQPGLMNVPFDEVVVPA